EADAAWRNKTRQLATPGEVERALIARRILDRDSEKRDQAQRVRDFAPAAAAIRIIAGERIWLEPDWYSNRMGSPTSWLPEPKKGASSYGLDVRSSRDGGCVEGQLF